ncbi:hypothetical protein [Salipaludibacillus agaradhaerens]|nr:hypothetical protein [Salipaludibacillus agaradhaerens]
MKERISGTAKCNQFKLLLLRLRRVTSKQNECQMKEVGQDNRKVIVI